MTSAYIAALEKKLMEAERALYGFRAIFNNMLLERPGDGCKGVCEQGNNRSPEVTKPDLYPGQLTYPIEEECDT
jgi:hypothetical protein